MSIQRLQKVLSQAGYGSRRKIEQQIIEGLIFINGQKANLGLKISAADKIKINDKSITNPLKIQSKTKLLLYHKQIGEIVSEIDPEGRATVFDNLPVLDVGKWIAIGRLDYNTSGLLLFTNNGDVANKFMHPRYGLEREYAVRVFGKVDANAEANMLNGIELEDGLARFKRLILKSSSKNNSWYHVVLTEGRNREVRRIWESQQIKISRLVRVRFGPIALPDSLLPGQHQFLSDIAVDNLLK